MLTDESELSILLVWRHPDNKQNVLELTSIELMCFDVRVVLSAFELLQTKIRDL